MCTAIHARAAGWSDLFGRAWTSGLISPRTPAHLRTHSWASCLGCPSTETRGTMWSGSSAGHTPEMTPPHVLSSYARTEGRRTPWSLGRRAGTGSGMDGRRAQSVQSATKIDQRHSHHLAPRRPPFGERCETWGKGMGQLTPSGIMARICNFMN